MERFTAIARSIGMKNLLLLMDECFGARILHEGSHERFPQFEIATLILFATTSKENNRLS
jgi:hypothetical protein